MYQQRNSSNPEQRNLVLEKANRRSLLRSVALQAYEEQKQIPQTQRRRKFLGVFDGNSFEQQALRQAIRPCPPRFHGENVSEISYGAFYDTNFQQYRNTIYESLNSGRVCTEQSVEPEQLTGTLAAAGSEKGQEKKLHFEVEQPVIKRVKRHEISETNGNSSEQRAVQQAIRSCPTHFQGENISEISYRNIFYESSNSGRVYTEPSVEPKQQTGTLAAAAAGSEKELENKLHFKVKQSVTKRVKRLEIFETDD